MAWLILLRCFAVCSYELYRVLSLVLHLGNLRLRAKQGAVLAGALGRWRVAHAMAAPHAVSI